MDSLKEQGLKVSRAEIGLIAPYNIILTSHDEIIGSFQVDFIPHVGMYIDFGGKTYVVQEGSLLLPEFDRIFVRVTHGKF